jgi:hypothetical protein
MCPLRIGVCEDDEIAIAAEVRTLFVVHRISAPKADTFERDVYLRGLVTEYLRGSYAGRQLQRPTKINAVSAQSPDEAAVHLTRLMDSMDILPRARNHAGSLCIRLLGGQFRNRHPIGYLALSLLNVSGK